MNATEKRRLDLLETTNGKIDAIALELEILIQWAQADAEHSYENHAVKQASEDRRRARALGKVLSILQDCKR